MDQREQPSEVIARFDDGSAVRRDPDTLRVDADPRTATLVLACARVAAAEPAAASLAWWEGYASGLEVHGNEIGIRHGGSYARVALADYRAVLTAAYGERHGGEALWLFRPDPIGCIASAGDRLFAAQLEERSRALAAAEAAGELDEVRLAARRQLIEAELHAAAVIDPPLLPRKIEVLGELGCARVRDDAAAAHKLHSYYASTTRAKWIPKPVTSIHDGVLSLAWGRTTAPAGIDLFELWVICEHELMSRYDKLPATGCSFLRRAGVSIRMEWRSEYGGRKKLHACGCSGRTDAR